MNVSCGAAFCGLIDPMNLIDIDYESHDPSPSTHFRACTTTIPRLLGRVLNRPTGQGSQATQETFGLAILAGGDEACQVH